MNSLRNPAMLSNGLTPSMAGGPNLGAFNMNSMVNLGGMGVLGSLSNVGGVGGMAGRHQQQHSGQPPMPAPTDG